MKTPKVKTMARSYPYSAFIVTAAYLIKPVTFVRKSQWTWNEGDITADGKFFKLEAIHSSKADAIAYGRKQVELREDYLEKQHALLDARRIKLDKAEKES